MKNYLKWIIGGVFVLTLCVCCVIFTKQALTKTLIVEDGKIKYTNNGKLEDVISLEELLTEENNTSTVNGKEVEFFVQEGYIVWNYVGETTVHKLIAIEDLVGKQGKNGADGKDGKDGVNGTNGIDGKDGKDGKDGINGTNGLDGKDGLNGTDGKDGIDGKDGTNGKDGKDGINGTNGKDGKDGKDGLNGTDGKDGTNGLDGKDGKDGTNAYIWVKYLDNDPTVSTDSDLKDISSAYMGIYYGTLDSAPMNISSYKWYKTKGEKGDKGDKGDTGAKGDKGDKGAQGIQGIRGETGAKGDKGDKGDTGAKGDKGDKGDTGTTYLDSVAIFKISGSAGSLNSCENVYKGDNINFKMNGTAINLNEYGDYVIETEGVVSFKSQNNVMSFGLDLDVNSEKVRVFSKTLSKKDEVYTSAFYGIKQMNSANYFNVFGVYPWSDSASPLNYHYEGTIKVYKK